MPADTTALTEARAAVAAEQARRDAPKCPEVFHHPSGREYRCNHGADHIGLGFKHDFGPAFPYTVNLRHAEALLAEVDRLTARVAELERARDVAGIVGWLRAKVGAAYGSGHVPGTAGWTYREIADAIERGDWREGVLPADPRDAVIAAARRLVADAYTPWESAGGPDECAHGRSLPCPTCDRAVVMGGGA